MAPVNRYLESLAAEESALERLAQAKRERVAADGTARAMAATEAARGKGPCKRYSGSSGKRFLWDRNDAEPEKTREQDDAQREVQCALMALYRFKSQAAQDEARPPVKQEPDLKPYYAGVLQDSSSKYRDLDDTILVAAFD